VVLALRTTGKATYMILKQKITIVFISTASTFGTVILSKTVCVQKKARLSSHKLRIKTIKCKSLIRSEHYIK
jgi:hypothetical protein